MKLRNYQENAADFLYARNRAMILASVGAGKTAIAMTAMQDMVQDGHVKRWLVLAPKRVAKEVWPVERAKWMPEMTMAVSLGTPANRLRALQSDATVVVTNYDNIQTIHESLMAQFDGIVFDELTRLKNPSGKRFKALEKKIQHIDIRWGLTGSFTSNGLEDVFGQCKIISHDILGKTKGPFMNQYFLCINREYNQWVPINTSYEKVMSRVKPYTYLLDNAEYRDKLPPLNIVEVNVEMDLEPYHEMKKEMVLGLEGKEITAVSAGALSQKLRQLSSGFAYDEEKNAVWFSSHKFDRLDEILEENQHVPTLVFYNFVEELDELKRRYPYVETLDTPGVVDAFNEGSVQLLAAHPASAGHGLNLQGTAHHMVFLSLPWSLELYEQAIGRLHRGGQRHSVWVYLLLTVGTIDQRVVRALRDKRSLSDIAVEELAETARPD